MQFLAVLEQNPNAEWQELLGAIALEEDRGGAEEAITGEDDGLADFTL